MAEFQLTKKAVEDLAEIWEYTFEVWSGNQADKYYESLVSNFQEIADNVGLGKRYEEITENLFGMKANRHIIFCRIFK